MTQFSIVWWLGLLVLGAGCSSRVVQTATRGDNTLGDAGPVSPSQAHCGSTLGQRIAVTTIDVDADIRYKREGYDGIPTDARLAFSVAPTGNSYLAWSDNALENVHVTPLSALQTRLAEDIVVPGSDVAGLVALNDGFALLVNRADPGEPLTNPNPVDKPAGKAVVLVRVRDDQVLFEVALTGTSGVTFDSANPSYDCSPERFDGRLAFDDDHFAAYFTVHGCQLGNQTYQYTQYYADKLVYLDDRGVAVAGGWNWGCQISQDQRLLASNGTFIAACMSDNNPAAGLNFMSGDFSPVLLAAEYAKVGFSAGQFGSLVRLTGDGSIVLTWLSRGVPEQAATRPPKPANDIALLRLASSPDYTPSSAAISVTDTPAIHEANLHAAPYGTDELLITWDAVEQFDCDRSANSATCFGSYTGTHFRLMDAQGQFTTPDAVLPYPPNSRDDLVTFPNGDVGWAYVPDDARAYSDPLAVDSHKVPQVSQKRQLNIARLLYCR